MSDIIHLNEPSTADAKCGATSGYQVGSAVQATLMEAEYYGFKTCEKCFPPAYKFEYHKLLIGGKTNGKTHLNEKEKPMRTNFTFTIEHPTRADTIVEGTWMKQENGTLIIFQGENPVFLTRSWDTVKAEPRSN